jgi:hypothetical protein
VVLGLVVRERRACLAGHLAGRVEVVDGDVEVRLHLLVGRTGRPCSRGVELLALEGEPDSAAAWLQHHPLGLVRGALEAQQALVERGEGIRVGRAEHDRGQGQLGCEGHASTVTQPWLPLR